MCWSIAFTLMVNLKQNVDLLLMHVWPRDNRIHAEINGDLYRPDEEKTASFDP